MHFGGEFQATQHFVLGFFAVRCPVLVISLGRGARDKAVGTECLELDQIRTSIGGDIDQLSGQGQVTVMVDTGFGNDEGSRGHGLPLPTNLAPSG